MIRPVDHKLLSGGGAALPRARLGTGAAVVVAEWWWGLPQQVGRVQKLWLKVFQAAAGHPGEDPPRKLSLVVSPFSPPHPRLTVTSATWPWSSGTTPVRLSNPTQSSDSAS